MKRHIIIYMSALLAVTVGLISSCSENSNEEEEYPNWQATNEQYFDNLYSQAKTKVSQGDTSWKVLRNWSFEETAATESTDFIVVNVLQSGTGSGCPLYTDSVRVHYEGRLLPSTSYPGGYVFDKSYSGDYSPDTSMPSQMLVSGVVDGFATALQNMHIGDRWRIYIPYQLGYGTSDNSSIPAYSTLVFDVTLVAYYRAGAEIPDAKAKQQHGWVEE